MTSSQMERLEQIIEEVGPHTVLDFLIDSQYIDSVDEHLQDPIDETLELMSDEDMNQLSWILNADTKTRLVEHLKEY